MDLTQTVTGIVLLLFAAGMTLLFASGHALVRGSSKVAEMLGIRPLIIGLTIVALGTSMPEFIVSLFAALKGSTDVALGNIIGSNVSNLGLILGLSALVYPIKIHLQVLKKEVPVVLAVSIYFWIICANGELSQIDGLTLFIGFLIYIFVAIRGALKENRREAPVRGEAETSARRQSYALNIFLIIIGIAGLAFAADLTVDTATELSRRLGVPELVIGLTVVAFGTSLPELATSFIAALKKEGDISIGNIIGSNLFNMMAIAGPTALARPLPVSRDLTINHLPIMVGLTAILLPLLWSGRRLSRSEGAVLVALYILIILFWTFGFPL